MKRETLRRICREADRTWVGKHWPSMETLRVDGVGVDFTERGDGDRAIRRFLSTFSPEFVLGLLAALAEREADDLAIQGLRIATVRASWYKHPGRHRYRMLANMPHPVTGLPTYIGCDKCGKPQP